MIVDSKDIARIRQILERILQRPLAELAQNANLVELGMRSMDLVTLVVALEIEFDVQLPDSALQQDNFATPAAIANIIAINRT